MFTKAFLHETGLYKSIEIAPQQIDKYRWDSYRGPPMSLDCSICGQFTTWNQKTKMQHVAGDIAQLQDMRNGIRDYARQLHENRPPQAPPANWTVDAITYTCESCQKSSHMYIVRFDMELTEWKTSNPPIITTTARKVGQWPMPFFESAAEVEAWLGPHRKDFLKGRQCERFGLGLGAAAYYRRIVEDVIDTLLNDIESLFENDAEREAYLAKLEEAKRSKAHTDKIAIVKDFIPSHLKNESANPLGFLHSLLSVSLHAMTEDDALTVAGGVRGFLVKFVRDVHTARQRRNTEVIDMDKLKGLLDKYTPRAG